MIVRKIRKLLSYKSGQIRELNERIKQLEQDNAERYSGELFTYRDINVVKSSLSVNTVPSINEYVTQRTIARGSFGVVYQAINTVSGKTVAIKKINTRKKVTSTAENEIQMLITLGRHPHIVELFEFIQHETCVYLVLELCDRPIMTMMPVKQPHIKDPYLRYYTQQIVSALSFLHDNNICHQDLKPENILLTLNGQIRLSDFGISSLTGTKIQTGTLYFMAPEILQYGKMDIEEMADIWSLGVTIFCLATGTYPFYHKCIYPLTQIILSQEPVYPESLSPKLHHFIFHMLKKDYTERISMIDIKRHHWLTDEGKEVIPEEGSIYRRSGGHYKYCFSDSLHRHSKTMRASISDETISAPKIGNLRKNKRISRSEPEHLSSIK